LAKTELLAFGEFGTQVGPGWMMIVVRVSFFSFIEFVFPFCVICLVHGILPSLPWMLGSLPMVGMFGVWTSRSNPGNYFVSLSA
jgi:hypothetical protein